MAAERTRAWFLLVVAVVLIAYARSFTAPFQFDDYQQVLENPAVQTPSWSTLVSWGRTRMIPTLTLALNYRLGGESVLGYHLVNLAVHLLSCWFVFALVLELCRTPRLRDTWLAGRGSELALGAALLFACHPLQVQAVTYIVQRMSSLAACFYIGAVLWYVRARNAGTGARSGRRLAAFAVAVLLAIGAFFSKENTASLPVAILLAELVFFAGTSGSRAILLRVVPFALLMLIVPVTFLLLSRGRPAATPPADTWMERQTQGLAYVLTRSGDAPPDVSPLDYLRTQWVVIPRYLKLVLLPLGLNVDHDVPIARGLSAEVAAGLILLLALFGLGIYAAWRAPLVGFGLLWFFVALSVESSIFPIRDIMNEHRMYLAMPGVALVLGCAFIWLRRRWPAPALGAGTAILVLLTALTLARNEVWRSQLGLWQDALAKSPGKARPHVNAGTALHLQGEIKRAVEHYCKALEIEPGNRRAESNINVALDQLVEEGEVEMVIAVRGSDGSIELEPRHPCPPGAAAR
jgi:hypothetical protein